ncbi:zinc finger protein [Holotrichia oblita]|uniref:Zinc finger protein n=1 Tax=Holotrichia oblita TaxID=644536 RepID=A0ACB9ST71_HOLOL|nr:zinc finger protein [Holotrichia oblita]
MNRHPILTQRVSQNLTSSRAADVTEEKIRAWFEEIESFIEEENVDRFIWEDPKRIFNADETAFFLSPKGQQVLVRKGEKTIYNHINSVINVNAAGMIVPPMVVFQYERIPPHITNLMPSGATFYEYITNIFYPWCLKKEINFPIVSFVDGHCSHLTMALSEFCKYKKIILCAHLTM